MSSTRRDFIKSSLNASIGSSLALHGDAPSFASAAVPNTNAHGAGAVEGTGAVKSRQQRPNILLLFPDQWRFDWVSTNPHVPIRTPNLDRLAKAGTRFTNAVVATPQCAPSRACLASGMAYGRAGVASNAHDYPVGHIETFYSMLRDGGYHVLACGKMDLAKASAWWGTDGKWRLSPWGFSDGINNAGKFDQLLGYKLNNDRPADPYLTFLSQRGLLQEHLQDFRSRQRGGYAVTYPTPLPDDAYCDNWVARNGLDLLDAAPKDKPWFLQVNWTGPHNPEDITAPMESRVRSLGMPAVNRTDQYDAAVNQAIRQNYTAMCENIDRNVGLYLDKLASLGQLDNTIILFSSDHGEMLGDHGRWGKIVPYHPSASVPLTIAGPGIARNTTSEALVSHIDLTATCLDYAGISAPAKIDGQSLRTVLEERSTAHRDVLFSGLGAWRMAFDGEYKAVTGFNPRLKQNSPDWAPSSAQIQGVAPLVFDRSNDPGENRDLYVAKTAQGEHLLQMLMANAADG